MKTIKDKQLLMAADSAGYPLKEAIKEYLEAKGWAVTDIGVKADSDPDDPELMFRRSKRITQWSITGRCNFGCRHC